MKTPFLLSTVAFAVFGTLAVSQAADSKRTAEYLLSAPQNYENKAVTVDVAAVKPANWKSPFPELAFFHAMTLDRMDHKPGGVILVAVPSSESAAFAKKYGTDFEGRFESDPLKGLLVATGPRKVWVIDVSGQLGKLLADRKALLPEEAGVAMGGGRFGPGRGPRQP